MSKINCDIAASVWDTSRFGEAGWYRLGPRALRQLPSGRGRHNAVWIEWDPEDQTARVLYYGTYIATVDFRERKIQLDSGGYRTVTTMQYLNCVLDGVGVHDPRGIGRRVYQRQYEWFVSPAGGGPEYPFVDGITFTFGGMTIPESAEGERILARRREPRYRPVPLDPREAWMRRPRRQRGLFT
jgi:hypothetical protein